MKVKKESYPVGRMIKRLLRNVDQQNKALYLYFLIFTITAAIYPIFSVLLPKFLIEELTRGDSASITNFSIIIGGYFILTAVFGFTRIYLKDSAYPKITALRIDYVRAMFDKIVSIDYAYMEDANFFNKNERALQASSSNDNGIEAVYHHLFEAPAEFIAILVFAIFIGMLNIWILIGLLINIFVTLWVNKKVHQVQYKKKQEIGKKQRRKNYYYQTTHDFSYGKDIRLYNFKGRIMHNYHQEIMGYVGIFKSIKNRAFLLSFFGLFTLLISDGLTYGILINKTVDGMSIANFSMYIAAIIGFSILLKSFTLKVSAILNEGQYVHDFYEFMDRDMGEKGGDLKAVKDGTLEVEFKNVSFKYPNTEHYIFKNLNLTISKGEKLAIVGINGAGKSTLVKLMLGLFDVTEGEILINKTPINQFNKKELFSMFSVVFQDINILAYTIRENVACTSDEINDKLVTEVLEKVGLLEKVTRFEKGLNQMMLKVIDEKGTEFSGGENQKLAIARALYKNGNMVIMDEPTAALDALAESEIYSQFSQLVEGKTAVYISHRLASTKFCDKIAFFDQDGLKEYGSHLELMNQKGSYYQMFKVQGKYYNDGGVDHA